MESFIIFLSLCLMVLSTTSAGKNISTVIGKNVTLPCEAKGHLPFDILEWSKPGTNTEFVLIYRNQTSGISVLKQCYAGRVELGDINIGNLSLILRNVKAEDSGTYECYVLKERNRKKRKILQPISIIYLDVLPPPLSSRGHIGLMVVASMIAIAAMLVSKKWIFS
ncbi:V-set domain-containing T-cell activation inhibitor 1-like [Cyprinodon tularosa]|uniref:V-set domain-containing T-cell activation inhibitor 1-like n=1 Tax=Cyprinodon tularosa TaxID=77115 RepID=UPI0018E2879B|nr:V-set domain-containing T-cell activation inhibitor 1-like [Cyprinodon tularosa]